MFVVILIWCFTKIISFSWSYSDKRIDLTGFVLLAFAKFGGENATASDKFKVSFERVSVFTATEMLLKLFEPLIDFWDLSSSSSVLKVF